MQRFMRRGLGGFFSDLFNDAVSAGKQYTKDELNARIQGRFGGDHIAAQNEAFANIRQILDDVNNRVVSRQQLAAAADEVMRIGQSFYNYATQPQFGTRGRAGASEILKLAQDVAASIRRQMTGAPTEAGGSAGGTIDAMLGSIPTWALLLGGLFIGQLVSGGVSARRNPPRTYRRRRRGRT